MTEAPERIWAVYDEGSESRDECPQLFADFEAHELDAIAKCYGVETQEYTRTDLAAQAEADAYDRGVADARKVKELEWSDHPCGAVCGTNSDYSIVYWPAEGLFVDKYTTMRRHGSLVAAKAAAQADYERRILSALTDPAESEGSLQDRTALWMDACFGPEIAADKIERQHRFLEEALELVQATGCTKSEAMQLVDYVYGRDIGDPAQEVGGVVLTLAALCLAHDFDMLDLGEIELARVWTKVEQIRAKQAAKPKHSPLPQHADPSRSRAGV